MLERCEKHYGMRNNAKIAFLTELQLHHKRANQGFSDKCLQHQQCIQLAYEFSKFRVAG